MILLALHIAVKLSVRDCVQLSLVSSHYLILGVHHKNNPAQILWHCLVAVMVNILAQGLQIKELSIIEKEPIFSSIDI